LKPGGQLLFLEHVRSDDAKLARWQDRLNGLEKRIGHGCNCNRPTLETIKGEGFAIAEVEHDRLPKAPAFVRPLIVGAAQRTSLAALLGRRGRSLAAAQALRALRLSRPPAARS